MITVKQVETAEEKEQSLDIRRRVFTEEQGGCPSRQIEFEEDTIAFLAYVDGTPGATGRMRVNGSLLKFERVATLRCMRGEGLGKAIMLKMQETGAAQYPTYIMTLHAQTHAVEFYLKLGWITVGEPFDEAGIEHILMILPPPDFSILKAMNDPNLSKPIHDYLHQH